MSDISTANPYSIVPVTSKPRWSQIARSLGLPSLHDNDSQVAQQVGAATGAHSSGSVEKEVPGTSFVSAWGNWLMAPTIPNHLPEDSSIRATWNMGSLGPGVQNVLMGSSDYLTHQSSPNHGQGSEEHRRPASMRFKSMRFKSLNATQVAQDLKNKDGMHTEVGEGIEKDKVRRDAEARERAKRDQEEQERRRREQEEAKTEGIDEKRRRGDLQITKLWVDERERERARLAEELEERRVKVEDSRHLQRLVNEFRSRPRSLSIGNEPLPSQCTDEVPREESDGNLAPSDDHEEESSPTLEKLMAIHIPLDITGHVVIPDYRRQAHGGLAVVYSGIWSDVKVAVKVLKIRKNGRADIYWNVSNERRIKREINVWAALKHQNINEFLGYSTEFADFPAMVSPWCQGGTVSEYLERQALSVKERLGLAQDVGQGLKYLHQLKIVHGDVKPANVLVDDDGVAKLCDFGLVRLVDWEGPAGMTTTSPYTGTERYKAPELFITTENRRPVATFDGDIYSLGCIMLELIERVYPFQRFTKTYELRDAIMDGCSPAVRSETTHALLDMTRFLWNLLEACWNEPSDRPGIGTIVEALDEFAQTISTHPFL